MYMQLQIPPLLLFSGTICTLPDHAHTSIGSRWHLYHVFHIIVSIYVLQSDAHLTLSCPAKFPVLNIFQNFKTNWCYFFHTKYLVVVSLSNETTKITVCRNFAFFFLLSVTNFVCDDWDFSPPCCMKPSYNQLWIVVKYVSHLIVE